MSDTFKITHGIQAMTFVDPRSEKLFNKVVARVEERETQLIQIRWITRQIVYIGGGQDLPRDKILKYISLLIKILLIYIKNVSFFFLDGF